MKLAHDASVTRITGLRKIEAQPTAHVVVALPEATGALEPRVGGHEPAFANCIAAVKARRVLRFTYRASDGSAGYFFGRALLDRDRQPPRRPPHPAPRLVASTGAAHRRVRLLVRRGAGRGTRAAGMAGDARAQPLADLESVDAGKHDVEHHEVGAQTGRQAAAVVQAEQGVAEDPDRQEQQQRLALLILEPHGAAGARRLEIDRGR